MRSFRLSLKSSTFKIDRLRKHKQKMQSKAEGRHPWSSKGPRRLESEVARQAQKRASPNGQMFDTIQIQAKTE